MLPTHVFRLVPTDGQKIVGEHFCPGACSERNQHIPGIGPMRELPARIVADIASSGDNPNFISRVQEYFEAEEQPQ